MNSKEISSATLVGLNHVQRLVFVESVIEQVMSSTVAANAREDRATFEYK